ncbi:MAG TPA: metalloregulator ArsR/SmtB family transcription factor [Acidobacteriaceae bacterium]|jgi:ArsR family transcriptional regulator
MMDLSQIEKISKALADQTRLMIFEAISCQKHMNCSQIVSLQGVTPATVSHHLKILVEAGLAESHREGQFVYNKAVPGKIEEYTRALTSIARGKRTAKQR